MRGHVALTVWVSVRDTLHFIKARSTSLANMNHLNLLIFAHILLCMSPLLLHYIIIYITFYLNY